MTNSYDDDQSDGWTSAVDISTLPRNITLVEIAKKSKSTKISSAHVSLFDFVFPTTLILIKRVFPGSPSK